MTRRLVFAAITLVVVLAAVLGLPYLRTVERYERNSLRLDLLRDAVTIGATVEDELSDAEIDPRPIQAVAARYSQQTGARVVIVDRQGVVRADSSGSTEGELTELKYMANRPEFVLALQGKFASVTRGSETLGYSSLFVAAPVTSAGNLLGAVRVSFPTTDVNRRIAVQRTQLFGVGLLATAIVAALAVLLASRIARPIAALQATTQRFGAGELSVRANTDAGPQDIKSLAIEFNTMAERLDDLMSTQHAFVADASHELRSPLTAIRLQLEAMEYADERTADERRLKALDEVNRLSRNVDGLLVLARRQPPGKTVLDIGSTVNARAEFWEPLMDERSLRLTVDVGPSLFATATPDRVATVIDNLMSNAIDAAAEQSTISITVRGDSSQIEIHIVDQGRGMSADQRLAAFDRFWRANPQPTALGGSGLGLAIARKLVVEDHGTIRLDPVVPQGIDAVVCYPRVAA